MVLVHQRVPERALLRRCRADLGLGQGEPFGSFPVDRARFHALANRLNASPNHLPVACARNHRGASGPRGARPLHGPRAHAGRPTIGSGRRSAPGPPPGSAGAVRPGPRGAPAHRVAGPVPRRPCRAASFGLRSWRRAPSPALRAPCERRADRGAHRRAGAVEGHPRLTPRPERAGRDRAKGATPASPTIAATPGASAPARARRPRPRPPTGRPRARPTRPWRRPTARPRGTRAPRPRRTRAPRRA